MDSKDFKNFLLICSSAVDQQRVVQSPGAGEEQLHAPVILGLPNRKPALQERTLGILV